MSGKSVRTPVFDSGWVSEVMVTIASSAATGRRSTRASVAISASEHPAIT